MATQPIVFDDRSFRRYLTWVKKGEQKFVMAKTLTQVAAQARKDLIKESKLKWTVRAPFVLQGYKTDQATKRNLVSSVGHLDWYAADQLDDRSSQRKPLNAKFRYIPLSGVKKTKRGRIPKPLSPEMILPRVNKPKSKIFFIDSKKKRRKLIIRRETKLRLPIVFLYKLVPQQRIDPRVSIRKVSERASSVGQEMFNRNMDKELAKIK